MFLFWGFFQQSSYQNIKQKVTICLTLFLKKRGDNDSQENLPDGSFNKYIKVSFIFL